MSRAVKPPRRYDASGRREQARATRRSVLAAARDLFLSQGYPRTTIAAVAAEAGVSVETVYKAFGNKPGLVKAVLDVSIVGDDEPVPMMEREFVQRNIAEPDPRRKLLDFGVHLAEVHARVSPLELVVRGAAAADPAVGEVWATLQSERLSGMAAFADHLHDRGYLRDGVSPEEARDVLWGYSGVELWDLFVRQRGWDDDRYGAWLGRQLVAALL